MNRKVLMLFAVLLMLVPMFGAQAQDEEPIRIGIVADLSGWLGIYGVEQVNGFKLGLLYAAGIDVTEYDDIDAALEDVTVAGRPIELLIRDYGSEDPAADADNAASITRELIEADFVDILYGTPNSGAALQLQNLTSPDEYNLLFMAGPAAAPQLTGETFNPNTFRICRNTLQDASSLATEIDRFGESYVVMAVDTAFGTGTGAAFDIAFSAAGATRAADTILVPSDTVDFTQYLQQVLDSDADMVVQVWAGAGGITLAQQTVELGVLEQMALVTGTNSNDIIAAAPPPEGTIAYIVYQYTLPDNEVNDWMTENHIAFYSDVPDLFTECSFATAQAVYAGLEATEGDPFPEAMIPALEGLTWDGPKGEYYIRPSDHQVLAPQYVISFDGIEEIELSEDVTMALPQYTLVAEIDRDAAAPGCFLPEAYAERCEMDMEMEGDE
ncbi:MAG: ABC transporter substrate-binding protein [Anaerolineae bacterium]